MPSGLDFAESARMSKFDAPGMEILRFARVIVTFPQISKSDVRIVTNARLWNAAILLRAN